MKSVLLTPEEYDYYGEIGRKRRAKHTANRTRGGPGSVDTFEGSEEVKVMKEMESLRAEFAVAKYFELPYDPDKGMKANADVADFIQVKWVSDRNFPLIVPIKSLRPDFVYILVRNGLETKLEKELVGWLWGNQVVAHPVFDLGGRNKPAHVVKPHFLQVVP